MRENEKLDEAGRGASNLKKIVEKWVKPGPRRRRLFTKIMAIWDRRFWRVAGPTTMAVGEGRLVAVGYAGNATAGIPAPHHTNNEQSICRAPRVMARRRTVSVRFSPGVGPRIRSSRSRRIDSVRVTARTHLVLTPSAM